MQYIDASYLLLVWILKSEQHNIVFVFGFLKLFSNNNDNGNGGRYIPYYKSIDYIHFVSIFSLYFVHVRFILKLYIVLKNSL